MALEAIDFLRFENSDYFQYWTAVVPEPPQLHSVPFLNVVLRPDGLLLDHLVPQVLALGVTRRRCNGTFLDRVHNPAIKDLLL